MRCFAVLCALGVGCAFDPSGGVGDTDAADSTDATNAIVDGAGTDGASTADASGGGNDAAVIDSFFSQAEDFTTSVSLDGVHLWVELMVNTGFNGTGYVRADPDPPHSECVPVTTNCGAELTYAFSVTVGGNYRLTTRGAGEDGDSDSIWWGIDGVSLPNAVGMSPNDGSWVQSVSADTAAVTPGSHVLNIWYREDGVELDTVALNRE